LKKAAATSATSAASAADQMDVDDSGPTASGFAYYTDDDSDSDFEEDEEEDEDEGGDDHGEEEEKDASRRQLRALQSVVKMLLESPNIAFNVCIFFSFECA
jgi:hypothetical protein